MLLSPWTPFCQFPYCDINLEANRPCSGLAALLIRFVSRGSSVGIVTGCDLDEWGLIAGRGKDCFSLPSGAYLASCPMCTRRREDHSPAFSIEIKYTWGSICLSPYLFMPWGLIMWTAVPLNEMLV